MSATTFRVNPETGVVRPLGIDLGGKVTFVGQHGPYIIGGKLVLKVQGKELGTEFQLLEVTFLGKDGAYVIVSGERTHLFTFAETRGKAAIDAHDAIVEAIALSVASF